MMGIGIAMLLVLVAVFSIVFLFNKRVGANVIDKYETKNVASENVVGETENSLLDGGGGPVSDEDSYKGITKENDKNDISDAQKLAIEQSIEKTNIDANYRYETIQKEYRKGYKELAESISNSTAGLATVEHVDGISTTIANLTKFFDEKLEQIDRVENYIFDSLHILSGSTESLTSKSEILSKKTDSLTEKTEGLTEKAEGLTEKADSLTQKTDGLDEITSQLTESAKTNSKRISELDIAISDTSDLLSNQQIILKRELESKVDKSILDLNAEITNSKQDLSSEILKSKEILEKEIADAKQTTENRFLDLGNCSFLYDLDSDHFYITFTDPTSGNKITKKLDYVTEP